MIYFIKLELEKGYVHLQRFEVLTAMKISLLVFGVLIPCGLLSGQQHFGGMYQLCLQSEY
jgi:hypothetical protein